jgi:hypothetical protein
MLIAGLVSDLGTYVMPAGIMIGRWVHNIWPCGWGYPGGYSLYVAAKLQHTSTNAVTIFEHIHIS